MPNEPANPSQQNVVTPTRRTCATMPVHERLLRTDPSYLRARVASENFHQQYLARGPSSARTGVTVIPVVVHVVHNTAEQNISDSQVQSQIAVLNRDYRMTNADMGSIPAAFQSLAADARIEFTLATKDPNGNPTSGITRTQTAVAAFSYDDGVKSAATGGADAWPADRYLNLWVCPLGGGLLGYAQFPGGPAATDGVVIVHSAFGTNGTATAPFNLGRTATHEIGHWLNLRHIWGDDGTGCNGSDFVDDTPNQAGENYGSPAFPHITCNNGPNGDLFMDYMDYVDDAAMFMFTAGQVDRMQACLDGDRSSIGTPKPGPTIKFVEDGGTPTLKFREDQPTIKFVDDGGSLKFRDDQPTIKFVDDGGSLKFRDDQPTIKFADDGGSLKFRDDQPTIKFADDGGPTLKHVEDVKQPGFDKSPQMDAGKPPASDGPGYPPLGGQSFRGARGGRAVPFVLSTPHHTMAWRQTFPEAAQAARAAYEREIQQYEKALGEYAQADATGQLRPEEREQGNALYEEYQALVQEYRQLVGG